MPQTASPAFDETNLPKGQQRKLTALRKSVGDDIANRAFGQWLKSQEKDSAGPVDNTAELIGERLAALVAEKKISIPRGGYLLTRGRGRVIVTRTAKD
ncbi:MAG: hypothetical protein V3S54_06935 [Woeseiaceae bacterium]